MTPSKKKVYYLASPFSTPPTISKQKRHDEVQKIAVSLIVSGYILIEPIAMCYYKSVKWKLPSSYSYWKLRDRKLISVSDGVIVVDMDGWQESIGVQDEISYAKRTGKPVYLLVKKDMSFKRL